MDVIESPQFTNIIVLQTVQNELKRRSAPNYKKLKTLISSGRKFFVFVNEFSKGKDWSPGYIVRFSETNQKLDIPAYTQPQIPRLIFGWFQNSGKLLSC